MHASYTSQDRQEVAAQHRYRTEIPNVILDMGLDPYEYKGYSIFKRTAGDKGVCFKSNDTLCHEIGCQKPKLIAIKKSLAAKGLITITKRKNEKGYCIPDLIHMVDIWDKNIDFIENKYSKAKYSSQAKVVPLGVIEDYQGGNSDIRGVVIQDYRGGNLGLPKEEHKEEEKEQQQHACARETPEVAAAVSFEELREELQKTKKQVRALEEKLGKERPREQPEARIPELIEGTKETIKSSVRDIIKEELSKLLGDVLDQGKDVHRETAVPAAYVPPSKDNLSELKSHGHRADGDVFFMNSTPQGLIMHDMLQKQNLNLNEEYDLNNYKLDVYDNSNDFKLSRPKVYSYGCLCKLDIPQHDKAEITARYLNWAEIADLSIDGSFYSATKHAAQRGLKREIPRIDKKHKIYECLIDLAIDERSKIQITRAHKEVDVKNAVDLAKSKKEPPRDLAAFIAWAAGQKLKPPLPPEDFYATNREYAMQIESKLIAPINIRIESLSKHVEIVFLGCQKQPVCIPYTASGFKSQLDELTSKYGFRRA